VVWSAERHDVASVESSAAATERDDVMQLAAERHHADVETVLAARPLVEHAEPEAPPRAVIPATARTPAFPLDLSAVSSTTS
jgi:hypothetical protein